jgi:hypothetical protein
MRKTASITRAIKTKSSENVRITPSISRRNWELGIGN